MVKPSKPASLIIEFFYSLVKYAMEMIDEECIEIKQKRVAEVAKGILDGSICYLGGY